MVTYPYEVPALKVVQPIGTFYVAVLPAALLLDVARSETASAVLNTNGVGYEIVGTQRLVQDKRLSQIADYIDREDATFPNSIILAANYNSELGFDQDETEALLVDEAEGGENAEGNDVPNVEVSWSVIEENGSFRVRIPTQAKIAAIVDGQHRLFAFTKADAASRLDMNLICSIFLDLPKSLQAQVFATVNSTQKQVDRSLTYELFGYNIADEPNKNWTPDKLAVFLTRKLATDEASPLRGRISVAPKRDTGLQDLANRAEWRVSTAVVVDGILRLFSSNPKRDSNLMRTPRSQPRTALRDGPKDKTVLRGEFIELNDQLIYTIVENYLNVCENLFWAKANEQSFIYRTAGVLALFDILRQVVPDAIKGRDVSLQYFTDRLKGAATIDFSQPEFRNTSGSGRIIIRKAIENAI